MGAVAEIVATNYQLGNDFSMSYVMVLPSTFNV